MWGIGAIAATIGACAAGSNLNINISVMINNMTLQLFLRWISYLAEGALVHLGAVVLHLVHLQHMAVREGFVTKFATKWFERGMCAHVHLQFLGTGKVLVTHSTRDLSGVQGGIACTVQSALTSWHMASMALHNTWQNNLHVTIVALVVIKIFFLAERFKTLMTYVGNLTSVRLLVKN